MMKKEIKNKSFKSKLKFFAVTAFAIAAVSAAAMGAVGIKSARAEEWKGGEIKQSYVFGETLKVPDYVLSVNGKELKATSVVEFPDGTNYGSDEVRLSQAGEYGVKYMATDGGKIYVKTFGFNVGYTAYNMSGAESLAEYGKYTEFEANSEGLKVRLAKGDTLSFTKLIDVADLNSVNNLIEGFITPDKRGTPDFDKLTLTLTDAFYPSIYVNVDIMRWTINGNALGQMCIAAAGQGQVMTGYERSSGLEVNNGKGTLILGSWVAQFNSDDGVNLKWGGATTSLAPDKWIISVAFDALTTKVSAQGNLVSQLNSVDYYKDVWTGFKSDKVRLSLSASGYSSTTANFCLTKVLGADIVGNSFSDNDAPIITVNTGYENLPEGVVGKSYTVPTAGAYDDYSGELIPDVNVYYNYSSAYPVSVSVLNGAFVPEKPGYYAIVYKVKDYSGNESEKVYIMHAGGYIPPIRFTALPEAGDSVKLGYPVDFGGATVEGGSGDKNITVTASFNGENFEKKLCSVKVEYQNGETETYTSGESFIPVAQKSGDKVKITYYCGKEEYNNGTYEVAVLKIRDDQDINCSEYFYGKGFITSYVDDNGNEFEKGVLIAVEKASAEVKWTFANAQVADAFMVEFTTFAKLTKFSGIKVTLKDSENPSVSATLNIAVSSTGTTVSNGDFALDLKTVLTAGAEGVRVGYKNGKFSFNKTNVPVSKYDNGEEFDGFPSGKVYFDFAVENASRGAEYKVDAVSGNVLSSDTGDYAKPTISINGDYGGNYHLGDEYVLNSVTAGDTFSPNVSVKLSVYDGEGNIASDINGVRLENVDASKEYVVKLNKYGVWNAKYTANKENWAVGSRKFTAYINVIDAEAPVIAITSEYTETAKAGDTIILPDFTATDNVTASDKLTVMKYVINTEGKMTILDGGSNSFKTTKAGKYVMCIIVSDEFGNTSTESFVVTVE